MMKFWMKTAIAALALAIPASASALTYIGNRSIGLGSAALSITTDGTLGALSLSNIVGWTIGLDNGAFTLIGPDGMQNSAVRSGNGAAFFATATDLSFDFGSGARAFVIFDTPENDERKRYYCVQTGGGCIGGGASDEALDSSFVSTEFQIAPRSGIVVLASVAQPIGAVPEPASWALMIAGFGLVGGVMRRRRTVVACS
jgi:PEP-CTERM motif